MNKTITPPFLRKGDKIGIIAPGYYANPDQWETVKPLFHSWGLQTVEGKTLSLKNDLFAGNTEERLSDLVDMMCNPDIKAIICARGGYGAVHLLPALDSYLPSFSPKWLIGYSDVTLLLTCLTQRLGWQCIHGPMPVNLHRDNPDTNGWNRLHDTLFGRLDSYIIPTNAYNRVGEATAPLTGGNLSIIYSLNGTPYQCLTDDRILFIEDVGEPLHHFDRMMNSLRLSGQMKHLKGLIIGDVNCKTEGFAPFGATVEEIVCRQTSDYRFPIAFGFPAGHGDRNMPLVMGASTTLCVNGEGVTLSQRF